MANKALHLTGPARGFFETSRSLQPARQVNAVDLTIRGGRVVDVTNLSGTFEFDDPEGLKAVAEELRRSGLAVVTGSVRLFPSDGSRPVVLE